MVTERHYLTVKALAQLIAPSLSAANIAKTMRQLRHWTQNDLLETVGGKETGTGIPRLYETEPTPWIAAILLELARYGATLEVLKPAAQALYDAWEDDNDLVMASETQEGPAFAQVSWQVDPDSGRFTKASIHFFHGIEAFDGDETVLESAPVSSILINLTQVMDKLYGAGATADRGDHDQ
ncbi:hypothetical protein [Limibacillus halophilus]|uniref:HTH merR-type domain-containing protein n=1 Tax=Limibacillus halophilus TaxID=1579333 RepID=A0A839STG2_9PROT|nr:hypothetical protein [Limibacillus halophilus]MBB3065772.1 hypothetical protein [Limibacillus halophilus]